MIWFIKKFLQIQEYKQYNKKYCEKREACKNAFINKEEKWKKIYIEQKSVEPIVIHRINPECFGNPAYPCVIKRLGWDRTMPDPDKENYCPRYTSYTPCTKSDCVHYNANQEYFLAKKELDTLFEEFFEMETPEKLCICAYGKLAKLIKKRAEKKDPFTRMIIHMIEVERLMRHK